MSKCVLLSIRPQWCEMICNGKKTIEVRKSRPKLETPFKCYIYCTIGGSLFTKSHFNGSVYIAPNRKYQVALEHNGNTTLNGKVIGEFVCDRIDMLAPLNHCNADVEKDSCLTREKIVQYLNGKGYGWHISALQIYDKPKELGEFYFPPEKYCEKELCGGCPHDQMPDVNGEYAYDCEWRRPITRAPQSWCYVEELL